MAVPVEIGVRTSGTTAARAQLGAVKRDVAGLGASTKRIALGGAAALGITSVVRGLAGVVTGSVKAEAQFSTTMRLIGAATKAPKAELDALNKLAIDLGASTQFSAGEAADAMLELAKAGLDTKTIMGGGVKGTLLLAAAGGTELATASTIAANALNTFGLKGRDMASVASALAGGANASSASVESLGQALQQVGPGATNAGLSLNETVAALSAFDAAGIKGSDAGTSLKTMLARLVPASEKAEAAMESVGLMTEKGNSAFIDAKGNYESLATISGALRQALGKLSEEERTVALNRIFGSDASRAATVLMKEGRAGVERFTRATEDQNAAQKMAKARMEGTEGALERLSGVVETAKLRIGQELSGAVVAGADSLGGKLLPTLEAVIGGVKSLAKAAGPGIAAVIDVLRDLAPSGEGAGSMFRDVLIPAVETASSVLQGFADLVGLIPDPVKDIGVQVGIAALLFPRLAAAATGASTRVVGAFTVMSARARQYAAEMTYATTRTTLLGNAARTVAGVAGLVALGNSASETNPKLKALGTVAGSAALGFAIGGPWGAAAGLLYGVGKATWDLTDKTDQLKAAQALMGETYAGVKTKAENYADTLDQLTGATTRATRQAIEKAALDAGIMPILNQLDVHTRDLTGAVLGQEGATRRVNRAFANYKGSLSDVDTLKITEWLRTNTRGFALQQAEIQRNAAAGRTWRNVLKSLPPKVRTEVRQLGADASAAEVRRLKRQYDLSPRQVRTIVSAVGTDLAIRKVKGVWRVFEDGKRVRPNLAGWQAELGSALGDGKRTVDRGVGDISKLLFAGTGKARANLGPFRSDLTREMGTARSTASTGGSGVGNALQAGVLAGFSGTAFALAAQAAAAVRGAIAAARAAAKAKSPSRETMRLGRDLGDGLTIGMRQRREQNRRGASDMVKGLLKAARDAAATLRNQLRDILDRKLKGEALQRALKSLADESRALMRNADAHGRVSKKLADQRAKYKDLVNQSREYAKAVKESIVASGSVTGLTMPEDGGLTPAQMLDQLRGKVRDAQRFADLVRELKKAGLNSTSLDQILQAGVSGGGLEAAETLAAGGAAVIAEVNTLNTQLAVAGAEAGQTGANAMFAAGIAAADGLVKGLERRRRKLDRAGIRLAESLARAIRKALGIKSPSRVFREVGTAAVEGLRIGLDDRRVKRYGEVLASSLVTGFGDPAMSATAAWDARTAGDAGSRTITLELTAEQMSQLERGRKLQVDLDHARLNGVRGRTF